MNCFLLRWASQAVRLVLDSIYFIFDNFINKHLETPMSSPLSSIVANLVMIDLEN